jgi:hypothetical protein
MSSACSACLIRPSPAPLVRFGHRLPLTNRWAHPVSEPGVVTFIGQRLSRHCPGRRCHAARGRPSPSRTWKELNRNAESPPLVSPLNRHCPVASRSPPRNGQPPLMPPPTEARRSTALLPLMPYKRHLHLTVLHHIVLPCSNSLFRAPSKLSTQGSRRDLGP